MFEYWKLLPLSKNKMILKIIEYFIVYVTLKVLYVTQSQWTAYKARMSPGEEQATEQSSVAQLW